MKDLSRHIEYLLCEHNSVAIPGIGLFVTEELPARYDIEECICLPPVRSVYLDTTRTGDDGKLEKCLIQLHQVTRNVARKWISDYVSDINQSLLDASGMDIGTIGRLVLADNHIVFEACEAGVNTPELYGLDSFHMPKLPAYALRSNTQKDATHFTIRLRKVTVRRCMAAAAFIIVALFVMVPNYGSFDYSSLASQTASTDNILTIFNTHQQPVAQVAPSKPVAKPETTDAVPAKQDSTSIAITADATDAEVAATPTETGTIAPEQIKETTMHEQTVVSTESSAEVNGYCVVMASAITHKGAQALISKLAAEGFRNAVEYEDKNMLRVLLTGYHNEEAARADMALVKATDRLYSGSWIKKF